MDHFSDRLKTVLADPEAMAKITQLARGFAERESGAPPSDEAPSDAAPSAALSSPEKESNPLRDLMNTPAIASALKLLGDGSRERIALLCAMRPFVREAKKEKLDSIIQTMKMLDLISSAQKYL